MSSPSKAVITLGIVVIGLAIGAYQYLQHLKRLEEEEQRIKEWRLREEKEEEERLRRKKEAEEEEEQRRREEEESERSNVVQPQSEELDDPFKELR
jgi:alpha-galactosidase/6-phospho-beta-glucosidase family protein